MDITVERTFSTADHLLELKEERRDGQKKRYGDNNVKIKGIVDDIGALGRHLILRAKNIGYWMALRVAMLTGTVLAATKCRGFLCTCYDVTPHNLLKI